MSSQKIDRFFVAAQKELKNRINKNRQAANNEDERFSIDKSQVIIAPYTFVTNYEHGKKIDDNKGPNEIFLLWLIAYLTRSGELVPCEENILPWVERRCLAPNESQQNVIGYPIIGEMSQVDNFYIHEKNLFEDVNITWETVFSFADRLFQKEAIEPIKNKVKKVD